MAETFPLPEMAPRGNVFPPQASSIPNTSVQPQSVEISAHTAKSMAMDPVGSSSTPPPSQQPHGDQADPEAGSRSATPRPSMKSGKTRSPPQLTIQTSGRPTHTPQPDSRSSSVTLRDGQCEQPPEQEETPVMRSMFPSVASTSTVQPQNQSLSRQAVAGVTGLLPLPPPGGPPRHTYSANFYPQVSQGAYNPRGHPSVYDLPAPRYSALDPIDDFTPMLSRADELLDLWVIANGQLSQEARDTYTLGLQCDSLMPNQEQMHFTSSTGPMYSLRANGNTIMLSRSHPLNAQQTITIAQPNLQPTSSSSPVLATISPTLAELLAADKASTLTTTTAPSDAASLEAAARARVQATESSTLLWDARTAAYYFTIPNQAQQAASKPMPVSIDPGQSVSLLKSSTQPLLVLSLHEATLTIHTTALVSLSSSQHTLDLAISTLMTLILHLHRNTDLLIPSSPVQIIPHFDPPPLMAATPTRSPGLGLGSSSLRTKSNRTSVASTPTNKHSRWLSLRHNKRKPTPLSHLRTSTAFPSNLESPLASPAPAAFRSPALSAYSPFSSPYLASMADPKDIEAAVSVAPVRSTLSVPIGSSFASFASLAEPLPRLPARGVAPELRRDVTGVDLSRFQAFDLSDPQLKPTAKALLRVLYWGFGVLVWVVGVGVGVLAALIVALCGGRGEGREKLMDGKRRGEGRRVG